MTTRPTDDEIQNESDACDPCRPSRWSGMTYEEGVQAALEWVLGSTDVRPITDA